MLSCYNCTTYVFELCVSQLPTYDYTTKGELKSITDEIGVYSRSKYDSSGNVTSLENGNGNKTSFIYDENL